MKKNLILLECCAIIIAIRLIILPAILEQKHQFQQKEKTNEEKRVQFERLRSLAMKERKEMSYKKSEDIHKILEKNKEQEKKKIEIYLKKQELIDRQKQVMESIIQENHHEKIKLKKNKEVKLIQKRRKNEELEQKKVYNVLGKINLYNQSKIY